MNPFTRLLLGSGRLPASIRAEMERDGLLCLHEGCPGSLGFHGFRSRHHYSTARRDLTRYALAVSRHRLVVAMRGRKIVDVRLPGPLPSGLSVTYDRNAVRFTADAAAMIPTPTWSGRIDAKVKVPDLQRVRFLLDGAGARV